MQANINVVYYIHKHFVYRIYISVCGAINFISFYLRGEILL